MINSLRNQNIDFLRGIAILLVLLLHFQLAYHLGPTMDLIAGNGNYGVTLFFVISGFLITSISLKRYQRFGNINAWEFYAFRFARIIPCLVLVLTIISLLNYFKITIFQNQHGVPFFESIISVLTFWHNVLMAKEGYFNYCLNIYWSLSVEEVFYLTFPLLALFFKKERYIISFWALLIILGPIYRSFYINNDIVALYGNFSCFDAISIGCLCAFFSNKINLPKIISILAIITMIIVYFSKGIMDNVVFGPSMIAFCTGVLLIQSHKITSSTQIKFPKVICWFGRNSYELYLFHIILLAILQSLLPYSALNIYQKAILLLGFLILSAMFCHLIAKFYSEPLNQFLRINLSRKKWIEQEKIVTGKN